MLKFQRPIFQPRIHQQKHCVKSRSIGNGHFNHPQACVVTSLGNHVIELQQQGTTNNAPLAYVCEPSGWRNIRITGVATFVSTEFHSHGYSIDLPPFGVNACPMWSSGTMELLLRHIDAYTIYLVGICSNDTMMRYLHTTARRFTQELELHMVAHDNYALILPSYAH